MTFPAAFWKAFIPGRTPLNTTPATIITIKIILCRPFTFNVVAGLQISGLRPCAISLRYARRLSMMIKYSQKNYHIKYQYREQTQAPEKRYTSHKSHQKWRITDWCQTSTHIGNQEDKEDHNMTLISSPGIHLNHRPYQKHAGTGCTDTA